ncbi:hypothetical protein SAMN05216365_11971 [Porphyromonadaceae bacterium NLAE-zl-C104]|nr:hypothetical protein SAMN05216365_11971 [Porphyromonadaceae bacterium NLAE-zl-C104]
MKNNILALLLLILPSIAEAQLLSKDQYKHYIDRFNENDYELYRLGEYTNEKGSPAKLCVYA